MNTLENKARYFAHHLGQKIEYPKIDKGFHVEILTGVSRVDGLETTYKRKRNGCAGDYLSFKSNGNHNCDAIHAKLLLKPLSSITDEDAIEVIGMFGVTDEQIKENWDRAFIDQFFSDLQKDNGDLDGASFPLIIKIIDYLRSKSYALPFNGISVDDMVSYGWIKLKEK